MFLFRVNCQLWTSLHCKYYPIGFVGINKWWNEIDNIHRLRLISKYVTFNRPPGVNDFNMKITWAVWHVFWLPHTNSNQMTWSLLNAYELTRCIVTNFKFNYSNQYNNQWRDYETHLWHSMRSSMWMNVLKHMPCVTSAKCRNWVNIRNH